MSKKSSTWPAAYMRNRWRVFCIAAVGFVGWISGQSSAVHAAWGEPWANDSRATRLETQPTAIQPSSESTTAIRRGAASSRSPQSPCRLLVKLLHVMTVARQSGARKPVGVRLHSFTSGSRNGDAIASRSVKQTVAAVRDRSPPVKVLTPAAIPFFDQVARQTAAPSIQRERGWSRRVRSTLTVSMNAFYTGIGCGQDADAGRALAPSFEALKEHS